MYQSIIHVFGISLTLLFPLVASLLAVLFYALFRWLGPGRHEEQISEGERRITETFSVGRVANPSEAV